MGEHEDLVLLHGFAGTRRTWDGVLSHLDRERYRPLALDLPGHGELGGHTGPIDFDACIASVLERCPDRFALCGYSMGGRIALRLALEQPRRVSRLTLVACSPGVEDERERERRRQADRALADEIEAKPIEWFAERWCGQPMFAEDPSEIDALARADYLRNDPRRLAAVLRGLGTGEMEPLWGRLGQLALPVVVLAGDRDAKFQAIAQRMADLLPDARTEAVPGGHRLPLESPARVTSAISTFKAKGGL
ncbi:MAG TPA: alpha/beta fold hydrolase [Solirubrobacteraceae bacterium]|nr:alpha/beta fold hydrolase [Solirubrobacteraceae bacterium]